MVLWKAQVLAEELREDRVSEREKLGYLLVGVVLQVLLGRASILAALRSPAALLSSVVVLLLDVVGLVLVFRANAQGDGRQFVERYICLAVPLGIRMYALYAGLALALYVLTGLRAPIAGSRSWAVWLAWWALYYGVPIWFFAAMRRWI